MKTYLIPATLAALALASCENPADKTTDATVKEAQPAIASTGAKYILSPDSTIGFVGSKVTGSHKGGFKTFTGSLTIGDKDEVTGGTFTIDMASTWADDEKLTGHLKSPDFFDVDTHTESTFIITTVTKDADDKYTVAGNFTLHGVTKNITFPATATRSGDSVTVTADFDINRKDFNINYPGKTDDLIRDEVVINLALTATPES